MLTLVFEDELEDVAVGLEGVGLPKSKPSRLRARRRGRAQVGFHLNAREGKFFDSSRGVGWVEDSLVALVGRGLAGAFA